MPLTLTDRDVTAALERLADANVVTLCPKRHVTLPDGRVTRGSPATVQRGHTLAQLPGEAVLRELEPYEVEGLVELARLDEVRLALIAAPQLLRDGPRPLPAFVFEDGSRLTQGDDGYPAQAWDL
jgi:hypothetical protein